MIVQVSFTPAAKPINNRTSVKIGRVPATRSIAHPMAHPTTGDNARMSGIWTIVPTRRTHP